MHHLTASPLMCLATVVALSMLFLAGRILFWRYRAPGLAGDEEGVLPEATILLPVRNEEGNVSECLGSLLQQTSTSKIVVIDDGSQDRTHEIVERIVSESSRVSLLDAGSLPTGWKGKVHALEVGLGSVATPWILSTDADTRHEPDLLVRALATAQARQLDSVSVAGFQETRGLGENLLTPAVFAVLDGLLGDWRDVADGSSEVANGQFFLVRTEALQAVGRFESVKSETLDDLALAQHLRAAGFRHGFFRAPRQLRIRMYRGLAETFQGWRRNLGAFFVKRRGLAAYLLLLFLLPVSLLLWGALTQELWVVLTIWAAGSLASISCRVSGRHPALVGLLYPLDVLLLSACILLGLRDASQGKLARWKGRAIRVG